MELTMDDKERERLKVLEQLAERLIDTREAAVRLRVTRRQAQRMLKEYRLHGDAAAIHGLKGRPANNAFDPALKRRVLDLVAAFYPDYGPSLIADTLEDEAGIKVNRETARRWMIAGGRYKPPGPERPHRSRRPRRSCFGELVQMDSSGDHDWLEGRGPRIVLITMIDDATGWKMERFAPGDSSEANMAVLAAWFTLHGRPLALYTDRASHFAPPQAKGKRPAVTQIGRALKELDVELIPAGSPQAKGRVERSHGVDQIRLTKGLRRENVRTIEQANLYLERVYCPTMNKRFARTPADPADVHRSIQGYDLDAILCRQETRKVANDWTVSIDGQAWQLMPAERAGCTPGQSITVEWRRDGSLRLRWLDRYLKHERAPAATVRGKAVDMPGRGQTPSATLPFVCPQPLNNSRSLTGPSSYSYDHSHDDDQPPILMEEIRKPVRIPARAHKPKPGHPWT